MGEEGEAVEEATDSSAPPARSQQQQRTMSNSTSCQLSNADRRLLLLVLHVNHIVNFSSGDIFICARFDLCYNYSVHIGRRSGKQNYLLGLGLGLGLLGLGLGLLGLGLEV